LLVYQRPHHIRLPLRKRRGRNNIEEEEEEEEEFFNHYKNDLRRGRRGFNQRSEEAE